ncbi:MAG TPA: hypothetical protein VNC78_06240 [Actinomycetota bacterium]|nr:hypothetical protein [Actinomycetota bacterium]
MIIRIFDTTMDPDDVPRAIQLFRDQVSAAFDGFEGCHGVEFNVGVDEHSGDLVEVCAISRWDSVEAIERATATNDYAVALAELRKLFQQNPIIRHFEVV